MSMPWFFKNLDEKKETMEDKYKEQGIERRFAITGHIFIIQKQNSDGELFFLNKDGYFYNTKINIKEFIFDTREELDIFIEDNKSELKSKYGDNIQFHIYLHKVDLGYCKRLE